MSPYRESAAPDGPERERRPWDVFDSAAVFSVAAAVASAFVGYYGHPAFYALAAVWAVTSLGSEGMRP